MSDADSYEHTVCRAAHDAVRALLSAVPDSPEGSAALREVTLRLARERGPVAVLDLAEELAVDLAEALDAIAAVEQRDACGGRRPLVPRSARAGRGRPRRRPGTARHRR
jgi:predicted ArsR family transcriptional regulator